MYNKNWYTTHPCSTQNMKMGPRKMEDKVQAMTITFWIAVVGGILALICAA